MRFPALTLFLLLGAIFTVALRLDTVQGDTWWALRAGQDMWHSHRVITTDTYSYTAYGDPWPDHSWLYQVILYALYKVGGFPLVSVVMAAVATLSIAVARPRGRVTWADVVAITPVIALVSLNFAIRPQVVSLLMLAVVIRLLHAERWRSVVLVMLVWANLHGGVVLGGLVLAGATVAGLVSWLVAWRRGPAGEVRGRRARFLRLALTTVASAAVTLVNPMGWGLWRYVATSSSRPGQEWIAEWQPSWTAPWVTLWFWVWCGVLTVALLFRWRRLLDWPVLLGLCTSLAMAPLAWTALRNISAFGIVTLPLLVVLLRRRQPFGPEPAVRPGSVLPGGRAMVAIAAVAVVASSVHTLGAPAALGWTPMSPAIARAIEACPGRVFTTYNSGAYLIWFTPEKKVFVDNRQDPYDAETLQFGVGAGDWTSVFKKYGITCAALSLTSDPMQVVQLGALAGWPVLLADDQWVILRDPSLGPTTR
ncbi:MAG: hypothetical protein QM572_13080 [Nocardioides sp.]|uniref:hypothetical protein n=1 Tax=Nocardioides sp. TaxID=35761 RepID=UPI0039E67953